MDIILEHLFSQTFIANYSGCILFQPLWLINISLKQVNYRSVSYQV